MSIRGKYIVSLSRFLKRYSYDNVSLSKLKKDFLLRYLASIIKSKNFLFRIKFRKRRFFNHEFGERYKFVKMNFRKFSDKFQIIFNLKDIRSKLRKFLSKVDTSVLYKYYYIFFFLRLSKLKLKLFFRRSMHMWRFFCDLSKKKLPALGKRNFFKRRNFKNSFIKYFYSKRNMFISMPSRFGTTSLSLGMYDKYLNRNKKMTQISFIRYALFKFYMFLGRNIRVLITDIVKRSLITLNTINFSLKRINYISFKMRYLRLTHIFFLKKWNTFSIKGPKKPRRKKSIRRRKRLYFY